jgi:hypothetical protein
LWQENRLRVFENWVLEKIFGPKMDELIRGRKWRRLHEAERTDLYSSPSIIGEIRSLRMGWAGYVTRIGAWRGEYIVLVGRPDGKIPLGRPRSRWEVNIKIGTDEVGLGGMNWIRIVGGRL